MDDPTASRKERHRPRRLHRISLRLFLVGITLCSLSFAWIASTAKRQKAAVAILAEHGAHVTYAGDTTLPNTPPTLRSKFVVPLTQYVDADILLPVTEVRTRYLEEPTLKAGASYAPVDVIKALSGLRSVETVRLTHAKIRNEDLAVLSGLSDLRHLDLSMTRLHEGDLSSLGTLDLASLSLSRTRVDDDGLKCLAGMSNLEYLDVTRTKVTGDGLRYIQSLPKLKTLRMQRCLVTHDEYERFKQLRPDITVKWSTLIR